MSRATRISREDGFVWAHPPTTALHTPPAYCSDYSHFVLHEDGSVEVVGFCNGPCQVTDSWTLVALSKLPLATLEAAERAKWGETAQERYQHMHSIKTVSVLAIEEASDGTGTVCVRYEDGSSVHLRGDFNADRTLVTWRKKPCHCSKLLLPDVYPDEKEGFEAFVCDRRATEITLRA